LERSDFDVLIVGAGLSGIGAACHLTRQLKDREFAILEAREDLGGTWDLFRYPGVRSDSDMYTLGYAFRPWTNPKSIADGPSILAYIRDTAKAYGVDRKIRYGMRVEGASWSSREARWRVTVRVSQTGHLRVYSAAFLFVCSGYYDYARGYTPPFPGMDRYKGRIVHPQHWPEDLDYTDKRVVVIGSGATAVTLVPELGKRARHVTMLQRSPTYIISVPDRDALAELLRPLLSSSTAYAVTRLKNVAMGMAFYQFCRRFPKAAKRMFVKQMEKEVGHKADVKKHFTPRYDPWDQRFCVGPNGDIFETICSGRASVVTDEIETFTETGLLLKSGETLSADVIVTATGFALKFLGGMSLEVDGARIDPAQCITYKGMMLSDVPNLAYAIGYTNASWTLKCDLACDYVCRLLRRMKQGRFTQCRPRIRDAQIERVPLLDFSSGYVQRGSHALPQQGSRAPWRLFQNYALDRLLLHHAKIEDGTMELTR
jgi:monooxygenase